MTGFWKKKKFWVIAGIGILLVVGYLWFSIRENPPIPNGSKTFPPSVLLQDTEPPTLVIEFPEDNARVSKDFKASVFEEDLETAIAADSCAFQVCAYDVQGKEQCTGVMQRVCGEKTPLITVDPQGMCSFDGREACFVYAEAKDLAGNKGVAFHSYHIDTTPPVIGNVLLEKIEENYVIQAEVFDATAIAACGLYLNERFVDIIEFTGDCRKTCNVQKSFEPIGIESRLFIRCSDIVRNSSDSEEVVILYNLPPKIDSCRVSPTKGTAETLFQFSLEASDPNQDPLSYEWEVQNDTLLQGKEVVHQYAVLGIYTPKVIVRDAKGLEVECNTAWVVVE